MNDNAAPSWKVESDADGIAWLTLDKPGTSANVLSADVLTELDGVLATLERTRPRGVVVISAKKSGFVAGADIKEFTGITDAPSGYALIRRGQQVLTRLASLGCPTVAAIHGFALGGGLELALACRYRVGVGDERLSLGLPEVLLGIHPGAATIDLPRPGSRQQRAGWSAISGRGGARRSAPGQRSTPIRNSRSRLSTSWRNPFSSASGEPSSYRPP